MANTSLVVLVIFTIINGTLQDANNNEVDVEDINPIDEATKAIFKEQNTQNVGSMVNNFLNSEGAKQIGDLLTGEAAGHILQGLGSILGTVGHMAASKSKNKQQGFDPAIIGNIMSAVMSPDTKPKKQAKKEPSFDMGSLVNMAGSFIANSVESGNAEGLIESLPLILDTVGSFMGPEAEEREETHSEHAGLLPPFLEKFHILFDHFINSEMGKTLITTLGAQNFVKVFSDEKGHFSYPMFMEKMENLSFRRHWIRMVTDIVAELIAHLSEPKMQKMYINSAHFIFNNYLRNLGFPKSTMFDPARPTETISAFVNYVSKKYFGMKISSKQYVKPAVEYAQELFRLAHKKGIFGGDTVDSRELSNKLTDTINLDIIEPLARVNRAFRFSKAVPKCERYVLCLINQDNPNEVGTLLGLRRALSRSTSLIASWFLTPYTGTPFWTLYNVITEENGCKQYYKDACNDFHVEEVKVTTEYVHSEL